MIIDGHAHACGRYFEAGGILETLDRHGVDKVILSPGEKDSKTTYDLPVFKNDHVYFVNRVISLVTLASGASKNIKELNESVYTLCQNNPDRLLQAYWVNPNNDQAIGNLDHDWQRYRFKMLKLHQCWSYFKCQSDGFIRIVDWALRHSLPIFIHLKSVNDARDLLTVIQGRRENVFIIAHLIGLEEFIHHVNLLDNVFFDISCPPLIPLKKFMTAFECFGSKKLLFGSDTPYGKNNLQLNIERINGLNISPDEKSEILGENLRKILDL